MIFRQKVYYTLDEISENLYTSGSEWMLTDSTEYIGLYHKYTTGEIYTQPTWDFFKSQVLIPYKELNVDNNVYNDLKPDIKTEYNSIQTYYPEIGIQERSIGSITRYFIKRVNSNSIIEINKQQFEDYNSKKIDPNINVAVSLMWSISGKVDDVFQGNVLEKGVKTKNIESIKQAETKILGLSAKLTNLLEFYTDTEFIVPTDINPK